jgi:hypothetical protein
MKVSRMRIRFEDPHITHDQAQAIALRVKELVTDGEAADRFESRDALPRHVAGRVSEALRMAGE